MKERGEATLFAIMTLVTLTGLMLLCSLELARSFQLLKKRTNLFLCTKEAKGELHQYLTLMGRTNWALENITRAQLVMAFIPGLQGVALNADKARKAIVFYQNINLPLYLQKLKQLSQNKCSLDSRMYLTPYELGPRGYVRNLDETARMRKQSWTYYYVNLPYSLSVEVNARHQELLMPKITYKTRESGVKSSSLLSYAY
ncbi:MAG TPA: hypothetical protein VNJ08_07480 [Bacteriovoracaceae bacterium]|nr:hypothetical protein [Bacteriovoracaceae bacterium]